MNLVTFLFCLLQQFSNMHVSDSTTHWVNPPGSSVHGIFQARILESFAISFFRGTSRPKDWIRISCIGRQIIYHWATWQKSREAFYNEHVYAHHLDLSIVNVLPCLSFLELSF